ncbi:MAG: non-ribosomal peptide synthetase [Cyanobacteria bacterium RI_101]|nr:non-ribosomal peptide synthetase [Cyanobacteria bacterium RI_101]
MTEAANPSLEQLSLADKRRLLAQMLAQKKQEGPQTFPLSLGQERIWRHSQLYPDIPLYNVAIAYDLEGLLDLAALERSLGLIIERHQSLRTTFTLVDNEPFQRVSPAHTFTLPVTDLTAAPEQGEKVQDLLAQIARTDFDLTAGPLWSFQVLKLAPEKHLLAVVFHHIISDGWSFYVFAQELSQLYDAFSQGLPSPLKPLPVQYTDIAQRQREWAITEAAQKQKDYWRENLDGAVPSLQLPLQEASGSLSASFQGQCQFFALSPETTAGLRQLSKQENVTLFMLLMASFQSLLYQYSRQEDMVFCTPVACRHRSQTKELIGYFNNILPLRTTLAGNPGFLELAQRVKTAALGAYKNLDLPFQQITDSPNLRQTAFTKILFSVDMAWPPALPLKGLSSEPMALHTGQVNFDLSLSLWETAEQIKGALEFKTDFFKPEDIGDLIQRYQTLLAALLENPRQTLDELPSLAPYAPAQTPTDAQENAARFQPPRTPLEFKLAQIWEGILGLNGIGIDDNLFTLGVSSLAVAQILEKIQTEFNSALTLAQIFQAPTIRQLGLLLRDGNQDFTVSPAVPIQPQGGKPPLFLCEGVGIYSNLISYLGADQPLYGLMRDTSAEQAFPSIESLGRYYLDAVKQIQPQGPYYLGGISFGGLVAFEMAQQLQAQGEKVGLVALFDTPGPGAYRLKSRGSRYWGHLTNLLTYGWPYAQAKLRWKAKRRAKAKIIGGEGEAHQVANMGFRALAKKFEKTYAYKPYPGSLLLLALEKRSPLTDSLFDPALGYVDPLLGWGALAQEGVEVHYFPGEHTTILREPFIQPVAQELKLALDRAQKEHSP